MDLPKALEQFVPRHNTLFLNLKTTDEEKLVAEEHPFGWVLRVIQKEYATKEEFVQALKLAVSNLDRLPEEERNQWAKLMWYLVLLIFHRREKGEQPELLSVVNETVKDRNRREEVLKMGITAAQALIEEGKEIGIEIGVEQGALQTGQEFLIEFIQSKFGSVPNTVENQIKAIRDINRLRELTRRIPKVSSIDEIDIE